MGKWISCALGLGLAFGTIAEAATLYDPALNWRTVKSARFAVHYPEGARNLAVRISREAEAVFEPVTRLIGFQPEGRIDIVLADNSDRANGSATVLPRNTIRLFLAAPTELTGLSSYNDWLRILLIHELAHICDIDQTRGITRPLRWLFGKYIQMNGFTPQFLSEGVAVYAETLLTPTGRGRSSYVEMVLRSAAFEDRFLDISQANIQFSDWPGPNAAYYYGGMFHLWLEKKYGRDAVRSLHAFNASMPLPYIYYPGAKAVFGESLPSLWDRWREETKAEAQELMSSLRSQGLTASRRITFHGRNITGSRYSPDGKFILYSRTSPVDGSTVRRIDRDGTHDRFLVLQTFSPRFSFHPRGDSFYYSQNAINERFNNFNDLYRYDLRSGKSVRLRESGHPKRALRGRDPDISPDGRRLVFVQNKLHQSWVTVGTWKEQNDGSEPTLELRTLVPPQGDTQHASPRFSPDGHSIALSTWFPGGRRDIVIVDAVSGEISHRVTQDKFLDGNPAWSPDGKYLLYESDADGISNLYAFELESSRYFRITRVFGGAFQPDVSPDGKYLMFRDASGIGFDIREMPFDPSTWEEHEYVADWGYEAWGLTEVAEASEAKFAGPVQSEPEPDLHRLDYLAWPSNESGLAREPSSPLGSAWWPASRRDREDPIPLRPDLEREDDYSPWDSLLPFNDNWVLVPTFFLNNQDPSLTLTTIGQDVLAEHTYSASVGSSAYTRHLNWGARYINDVTLATFTAGYADEAQSFERGALSLREQTVTAAAVLPWGLRHLFGLTYVFERRQPRDGISAQRLSIGNGQDFAWLQFGYTYRFTQRFPYSAGDEHGRSIAVAGRWYGKPLGADFNEFLLSIDGRTYINNPWIDNHVLALRFVTALALGPDFQERFALGGAQGSSFFSIQAERSYPLRGFALSAPSGTGLMAAYAEYRFPWWHIERGLWTIPVFMERFHGALFFEGGNLFGNGGEQNFSEFVKKAGRRLRGGRAGAGAEVRADVKLGWAFLLTLRLGAAWPVVQAGRFRTGNPLFYVSFGSAL